MNDLKNPIYHHIYIEGVHTYTRAEWVGGLGDYVHHLISEDEFSKAQADGKDARDHEKES